MTFPPPTPRPVVLCILDGWGYRAATENNAIALARTPFWDRLWQTCPHALLSTSGLSVGLPEGQMGNSEVGHMTIGAGRVIFQDLPKIDRAIEDGSLAQNPALHAHINALKSSGGVCHLMGLCSNGGVHAHIEHILALALLVTAAGVSVALHVITDGRDVAPQSALEQIKQLSAALPAGCTIATVSGRYYAMDRDKRWDRVALAYNAAVKAEGDRAPSAEAALSASYAASVTDEFVRPTVMAGYNGMKDGDGILFANFRADRAREILSALCDPAFDGFERGAPIQFAARTGMVSYSTTHDTFMTALFPPKDIEDTLGEVVARAGKRQLRLAETEKYAHVTFFMNGGVETPSHGEDRVLVASPKVATYDLQPEMSAPEVSQKAAAAIESGAYDLLIINYANADMVGHTGNLTAAIEAVEAVDSGLLQLASAIEKVGGALLITADHGNCEEMWDEATHGPHTAHSLNPVPVLLMGGPSGCRLQDGSLADIAPTLLGLMKLAQPAAMTGRNLVVL